MERLTQHRKAGINAEALRKWGALFLALGLLGRGVIQTHMLGVGRISMTELLGLMASSGEIMALVTVSLVFQAVETCAIPIYAVLLVDGVQKTKNRLRYLGRIALLALVCEIPYNLAVGGAFWSPESRNPVVGLLIALAMLCFYCRYSEPGFKNIMIKATVTIAAILWCQILGVHNGAAMTAVTAILWGMRRKPMYRSFAGCAVAVTCTVFSPFCLAAPMGFLAVHMYNGERETADGWRHYLTYPLMLLIVAAIGILL